jgi:hypothetical protein
LRGYVIPEAIPERGGHPATFALRSTIARDCRAEFILRNEVLAMTMWFGDWIPDHPVTSTGQASGMTSGIWGLEGHAVGEEMGGLYTELLSGVLPSHRRCEA